MSQAENPIADAAFWAAFRMPLGQTIKGRKTTVTNSFVNAIIPSVLPKVEEIRTAIEILGLDPVDLRCVYCGDTATEWDHLRPLVVKRRPTGYISEIANLVPSCSKCNQSKGNSNWREWMLGQAKRSPTGRGVLGITERIERLDAFEQWRAPICVDFVSTVGHEEWEQYWSLCEAVLQEMRQCQEVADSIRARIIQKLGM